MHNNIIYKGLIRITHTALFVLHTILGTAEHDVDGQFVIANRNRVFKVEDFGEKKIVISYLCLTSRREFPMLKPSRDGVGSTTYNILTCVITLLLLLLLLMGL